MRAGRFRGILILAVIIVAAPACNEDAESGCGSGAVGGVPACPSFDYPPTVTAVAPNSGPPRGGTVITVTGTQFAAEAAVEIAGSYCADVVVLSATSIRATTPPFDPLPATALHVTVINANGMRGGLAAAFTYVPN